MKRKNQEHPAQVAKKQKGDVAARLFLLSQQVDSEMKSLTSTTESLSDASKSLSTQQPKQQTKSVPPPPPLPPPAITDDFDMFGDDTPPPIVPVAVLVPINNSSSISTTSSSSISLSTKTMPSTTTTATTNTKLTTDMSHLTAKIGGTQAMAGDRDDEEGYYIPRIGEYLGPEKRYITQSILGSGVFSCVVRASDTKQTASSNSTSSSASTTTPSSTDVAVKLIRANARMKMSGEKELKILRQLSSGMNNNGKKYCITLIEHFVHSDHLAIVTECMFQSLRKLLKLHPSGISINAVRVYGKQLFNGLSYIHSLGILHADLKLDNIVISKDKKRLKICDFGSAMESHELPQIREMTELVSRFYRAPEIILGDTPTYGIDVWSAGCCLFEMCTGKLPFMGSHNNGMLRYFQELCGRFPKKVLTRSKNTSKHFNSSYDFVCRTENTTMNSKSFGKKIMKNELMEIKKRSQHMKITGGIEIIHQNDSLAALLYGLFQLAPEKRLRANQALKDTFFKSNNKRSSSK